MAKTRPPTIPQFSRRFAVETPEHVILEFELAGLGSRTAAAIYDLAILSGLILLLSIVSNATDLIPLGSSGWATAALIIVSFAIVWGYFVVFEGLRGGRTPGKRRLGIRVVMDTGHPVTIGAAATRNLIRLVDLQPAGASAVGLLFVFFQRQNKRLGDLVAGTIVVRDEPREITITQMPDAEATRIDAGPPLLSDEEFRLLDQFIHRLNDLPSVVQLRLTADLANRFSDRFPDRDPKPKQFLQRLHASELAKRRSLSGAGDTTKGPRANMAHRFVALRQGSWEAFRQRAGTMQRRGLKSLTGSEIVTFAGEYREVAADLARARTYGVDVRVLAYLERVVAAGHNVLYGMHRAHRTSLIELFLRRLPASILEARLYVLAACLLFVVPGFVGYALLRERPQLAEEIISPSMVARAESGERARAEGLGYAETPSPYLPVVASSIVANNVQVAFGAFAFGISAGVGTVLVLVFNGLFFGAVLGLFANYGLADWILTFVAGHGVLELSAIFIAGGAGLLIGRAVIAPGDLLRRDAIVVHGRLALRMLGAAVSMLILAGAIEGFLSASDAPAPFKLGVSAASLLLLLLYLEAGRRTSVTSSLP